MTRLRRFAGPLAGVVVGLCFCSASAAPRATEKDGQKPVGRQEGTDPAYSAVAEATGGKVFDLRTAERRDAFSKETMRPGGTPRESSRGGGGFHEFGGSKILLYVLLKWLAYTVWCFVGLKAEGRRGWPAALGWGAMRGGLGVGFGAVIFLWFAVFGLPGGGSFLNYASLYLLLYGPVRWVEWTLTEKAMGIRNPRWVAAGIGVSFAVDVLQMGLLGAPIPVGRVLC